MNKNIIIGILAITTLLFGGLYSFSQDGPLGAFTTEMNMKEFLNTVTMSGTNTLSGATTISGATTLSGTNTVTGNTQFSSSLATTTIVVAKGSATAGYSPGCIVLGDTTTSSTLNYITAVNGVLGTTTTQPAACRK